MRVLAWPRRSRSAVDAFAGAVSDNCPDFGRRAARDGGAGTVRELSEFSCPCGVGRRTVLATMKEDILEQVEMPLEQGELLVGLVLDASSRPAVGEHDLVARRYWEALGLSQIVLHLPL